MQGWNDVVLTGLLIFAVMLVFGLYQSLRITRPIETVSDIVDRIGNLDFTEDSRVDVLVKRKDETGVIAASVKNMRQKIAQIIEEIKNQSQILYSTSNELFGNAKETNENVSQIESAVGEIVTGANETLTVNQNVNLIGEMIVDTGTQVSELSDTANRMRTASEQAFGTLSELVRINEQTAVSIERIYEQTNETNHAAEKIKEAAALIADIADQTNLLSLNANIEASRAGESGKGFAVVATEVKKLAEESSESAQNIDVIVKDLVDNSACAVEIMNEVREIIQKQSSIVSQTEEAFHDVQNGIDASLSSAENIRDHAGKLDAARINITDTVSNLSEIASQNAEKSQDTNESMTHIIEALQVMTDGIDRLNEIAKVLDNSISEIRI